MSGSQLSLPARTAPSSPAQYPRFDSRFNIHSLEDNERLNGLEADVLDTLRKATEPTSTSMPRRLDFSYGRVLLEHNPESTLHCPVAYRSWVPHGTSGLSTFLDTVLFRMKHLLDALLLAKPYLSHTDIASVRRKLEDLCLQFKVAKELKELHTARLQHLKETFLQDYGDRIIVDETDTRLDEMEVAIEKLQVQTDEVAKEVKHRDEHIIHHELRLYNGFPFKDDRTESCTGRPCYDMVEEIAQSWYHSCRTRYHLYRADTRPLHLKGSSVGSVTLDGNIDRSRWRMYSRRNSEQPITRPVSPTGSELPLTRRVSPTGSWAAQNAHGINGDDNYRPPSRTETE